MEEEGRETALLRIKNAPFNMLDMMSAFIVTIV